MPLASPLFQTARLDVHRLGPEHVDDLLGVYGDPRTMAPLGDGRVLDRAACQDWVGVTDRNMAEPGYGMAALLERASGRVVGFCGLVHPGGQAEPELKYALRHDAWGRGLGTEAARAMLAWGVERFGLERIIATAAEGNRASHQVLEKCGMRPEEPLVEDDGTRVLLFSWAPGRGGGAP
jgi:RimJ/RimL family protein N-acetyltransferase